jgi:SAM-dependent methyltransferase
MTESKKSYYHAHESAYKKIKEDGYIGWGNVKSIEELGDRLTKQFLNTSIDRWLKDYKNKDALDLGCGTGTTAFELAKKGMNVTGIDISNTAIEMAGELSQIQNLQINFQVGDLVSLDFLDNKFELIYDSHFYHCIVLDEDRKNVLQGVHRRLSDTGIFILDTMVMDKKIDITNGLNSLKFDENFILWHKTNNPNTRGIINIENQFWCPQRRIYPSSKVLSEINENGFVIKDCQIDHQDTNEPSMLRLVLMKV